jgi:hypothetical protein
LKAISTLLLKNACDEGMKKLFELGIEGLTADCVKKNVMKKL